MSLTIHKGAQAVSAPQVKNDCFGVKDMYKVNPAAYSSVFAIPTQIADEHLRMAGKAQLKVLLWLYRNPSVTPDIAVIERDTGVPADEIDDAMYYWIQAGLVVKAGEAAVAVQPVQQSATSVLRAQIQDEIPKPETEQKQEKVQEKPAKVKPVIIKPSIKDIAMRLDESAELRSMFSEVQEVFGRTLGYDAQSSLIIMYDHYSLPASVIVMLCSHAKTIGKQGSLGYIMKTAATWSECGITDFESASEKIERMENVQSVWGEFRNLTGVENPKPTQKQSEYLEIWINDFCFSMDMIYSAYERTVEKKGKISWNYIHGILRSWHDAGYKTVQDAENAEREFAIGTQAKKQSVKTSAKTDSAPPSYDISLALKRSKAINPNKTKKGQ